MAGKIRAAQGEQGEGSADWIRLGGSFIGLPDGLEPEWYSPAVALAEQLQAHEAAGDRGGECALRAELDLVLAPAHERPTKNLIRFDDELCLRGIVTIAELDRRYEGLGTERAL